jgi:hypothetical protein
VKQIHRVDDPSQYEYKYYVSPNADTESTIGNYNTRVNLDSFMTPEMDSKRVIEFGSLYGSVRTLNILPWHLARVVAQYRVNLEGADPKWSKILKRIQDAMVFDMPVVETVANDMRALMGGRANHYGFHLRVGDGAFQVCPLKFDASDKP